MLVTPADHVIEPAEEFRRAVRAAIGRRRTPGRPHHIRHPPERPRHREPGRLKITVGISVGYGDDYLPYLEGQSLDITDVRPGRYDLVHRVNADRDLAETRYDNNTACVGVVLGAPRRRAACRRCA